MTKHAVRIRIVPFGLRALRNQRTFSGNRVIFTTDDRTYSSSLAVLLFPYAGKNAVEPVDSAIIGANFRLDSTAILLKVMTNTSCALFS